ncbi:MAG: hypothetical protein LBE85_03000 [Candidatus Accumulibacter sp.]|jgi:hypothetical protein|nr:hypothetical protein [Accumulibacter sp.]
MNGERAIGPDENRGAALLVLLLAIVLGISSALLASLAAGDPEIERRNRTLEVLAQAKQALIAWSVVQGDVWPATQIKDGVEAPTYRRPGTLPCPDTNFFGSSGSGNASGSCSTAGGTSIGRLPWKSLDMENLRDAHGEPLWYAVSDHFRHASQNSAAINSDTKGTLLLYAADGSTLATPPGEELAAVIFAPGPPLPGQDRTSSSDVVSGYLEAFDGKNNASAAGPFVMGPVRDANGDFVTNDLVIGVTARELIAVVEKRALKEAQIALKQFAVLPSPAPHDAPGCAFPVTNVKSVLPCEADGAICAGRLPEDLLSPHVAPWFVQNGWGRVMIYAISNASCTTSLKVTESPKNYVLFAPGTARQGQSRPSSLLSDYLENPGNADGWSGDFDFVVPEWGGNDQLRTDP